MEQFDRFRSARNALLDEFDPADFAEARPCPGCGEPLDEEANCFRGQLMCPDCYDQAFQELRAVELYATRAS